ncbi:zinc ribbon domain-containing protein [Maribellus sp. CM-23]|uniref:zinc ribbon domain-containing protein n=1 Tax=Maribellus sp. CM-23 TaxID=2781026 RepID=UPI001F356911|nr:zinc ribbon domain-containing protein [Maribellus sp. CM-23]MCE4566023.1 zinc ribbon domain-containing protein [Maribellus sp. CM-23]
MAYCENCGTKIISDSNFCTECGFKIESDILNPTKVKEKENTTKTEDTEINTESSKNFMDFSTEFGVKTNKVDFTPSKNNKRKPPKIQDGSKEETELDETFVLETTKLAKEFVERSSEIKDEDDIKIKDIKSFFELGERIEKLGSIAQESKTIESNNKTKISYDTLEIIESIVGVVLIIGLVIVLVIYFPDYKDNLPEWLKSIFE